MLLSDNFVNDDNYVQTVCIAVDEIRTKREIPYELMKKLIEFAASKEHLVDSAEMISEMISRPEKNIRIASKDVKYLMDHRSRIFADPSSDDTTSRTRCLPPLERRTKRMENRYEREILKQ